MAGLPGIRRGMFLRQIAANMEELGERLFSCVMRGTGLPETRVRAEAGRTCLQFRLFADLVEEGSWVDARIDRAAPSRTRNPTSVPYFGP